MAAFAILLSAARMVKVMDDCAPLGSRFSKMIYHQYARWLRRVVRLAGVCKLPVRVGRQIRIRRAMV